MRKNTIQTKSIYCTALLTYLFALQSYAQTNNNEWQVKVGAAILSTKQPWKGAKQQTAIAPYISATKGNWSWGVENLVTYHRDFSKDLSMDFGINLRTNAFDSKASIFSKASENPVFKGYKTPELEIAQTVKVNWGWLSLSHNKDISNNSKSNATSISLSLPIYENSQGVSIKSNFTANWYSASFVNYYYGISKTQVNQEIGRTFYQTEKAVNFQLSLNTVYPINRQWAIINAITYTKIDDNIFNSPLINQTYQNDIVLALTYSF